MDERVRVLRDSPDPPPVMTATMPLTLNKLLAARADMEVPEVIVIEGFWEVQLRFDVRSCWCR